MKLLAWSNLRVALMSATAGIAFTQGGAAYADEQPSAGAENSTGDIIVTAQRRSERLQDVPLSVTAISGETLAQAGITSTRDLALVTPGLRIESTGAYVQPTIRGISNTITSPTAESNIATYIDGVYQATQVAAIYDLPDVQQVEVLKGPQGTLFGRNATGGAILIHTLAPDLETVTGMVSGSYGRFNEVQLKGYVSAPIVRDKVALGLSAFYQNMDGYKRNILTGETVGDANSLLLRGKLRFLPWEGADFTLTGLYTRRDDYDAVKNTNYMGNNAARAFLPASQIASGPWEYGGNEDPRAFSKQWSVSLHGDIEAGPGTLTTTTAYTRDNSFLTSDSDNSARAITFIQTPGFSRTFQQELVYATQQMGHFRAVGGLFYYNSNGGQNLDVNRNAQTIYARDKTESYAAFGEVVYDLTDRLSFTAGIRYSHDTAHAAVALTVGGAVPTVIPALGEHSWGAWTPRFSLLFKATERTNLYFTYSQGFKSGLFNTISFQQTPINPEKVKSYEIGIKSNEIENLSFSLSGFYYDYTDLQQITAILTAGIPRTELRNAEASKIYGVEANASWNPSKSFSVTAGLTYLHARYTSFKDAIVNTPTGLGGNQLAVVDVSGNTLIRSPEWSGNITSRYAIDTGLGQFDATGTLFWSSKFFLENGDRVVQPAYALLNASVGLHIRDTGAEIRLWGKNLSNKPVIAGANISLTGDTVVYARPRTYGIEATYRF
jgi:iron complex outermembrane receptor protein